MLVWPPRNVTAEAVADLRGGPNSFNFMQFSRKYGKIVSWRPPPGSWCPVLGEILDPPLRGTHNQWSKEVKWSAMALKHRAIITRSPKLDISDSAKKSHCPWGPKGLLSHIFKQFITLFQKTKGRCILRGSSKADRMWTEKFDSGFKNPSFLLFSFSSFTLGVWIH